MRGEALQVEHKPLCADRSDMDIRSVFLCVLLEVLAGNCEYAFTFTRARRSWLDRHLMFDPCLTNLTVEGTLNARRHPPAPLASLAPTGLFDVGEFCLKIITAGEKIPFGNI